jgi:hypothetical protein
LPAALRCRHARVVELPGDQGEAEGKPDAEAPLRDARELFSSIGYKPALAQTETLLEQTTAAAS